MAAQNDGDFTDTLTPADSPFVITPDNAVRMLMLQAPAANPANVTYKGTRKWLLPGGGTKPSTAVPIVAGSFVSIPTDGTTILAGEIVIPAGCTVIIYAKT